MVRDAALTSESAAVAATSYDSSSSIWSKISSPLKSIPGPWYTSMNSGWYNVNLVKGTQLFNIRKLHKQYGPLVRVAPNIISVADPDAIRAMMSTHRFQKGNIYDGFQFGNKDNIFSTRDPDFYKTRRRLVAPAFTPSAINEMESVILDAGTYSLSAILEKHAEQQDVINMFDLFSFMTFDAMSEVMFGKSFGLLHGDNHPVLDWIQDTLMLGIFKAALGSISKSSMFSKHHESERKLIDFAVEAIRKRKEGEPRSDSLQRLMDARDEETDHSLEEREVATELIVQFIAGTDTTSCSLSWILYSLTQHPDCMKRLQAELDETIPDVTSHVTHAMVKDLPYLNAVCDEGLRLHSVAAGDPHRTVPPEGVELCGRFIPGGTTLIPQIYTLHHSENYWIKPDEFIPERWLTKSSEDLQAMRRCYMPFSVGVRACVGRSLAWAELRVTLAVLLRRFDFTFVPGANMEPHHRFIVRPTDGKVDVRVTKRAA